MINLSKEEAIYEKMWEVYENARLELSASGLSPAECRMKLSEMVNRMRESVIYDGKS